MKTNNCFIVGFCENQQLHAFHNTVYVRVEAFIFCIGKTCAVHEVTPVMGLFFLILFLVMFIAPCAYPAVWAVCSSLHCRAESTLYSSA
jgi:hypothetical protein